jgi:hypothetical protein
MGLLKNSISSTNSSEEGEVLFMCSLPDNSLLEIRPLTIHDLYLQCEWMYDECKEALELVGMEGLYKVIRSSFEAMAISDIGNSFMVLLDRHPACIIEATKASLNRFTQHRFTPGDHFISMLCPPGEWPTPGLMQALSRYFLSFPDVDRILIKVSHDQHTLKGLLVNTGFKYLGPCREGTNPHLTSIYYAA